jgi:hypothetical protein
MIVYRTLSPNVFYIIMFSGADSKPFWQWKCAVVLVHNNMPLLSYLL